MNETSRLGFPLFRVAVLALAGGGTSGHSVAVEGQTDPAKSRFIYECIFEYQILQRADILISVKIVLGGTTITRPILRRADILNINEKFLGDNTITWPILQRADI